MSSSSADNISRIFAVFVLCSCVIYGQEHTDMPTEAPTYGPASDEVVDIIFVTVIGGIIVILLFYFWTGWMLYERDVEQRMLKAEQDGAGNDFLPGDVWAKGLADEDGYDPSGPLLGGTDTPLGSQRRRILSDDSKLGQEENKDTATV
jgi:hypothetical protein